MKILDDITSVLPPEILLIIFSYVDNKDVFTLLWVCSRWRKICAKLTVQNIEWKLNGNINLENFCVMLNKFMDIKSITLRHNTFFKKIPKWYVTDLYVIRLISVRRISLTLWNCEQVTDVGITKIGEGCPNLQSLTLYNCEQVTDVGITKIAEGCPKIQKLNLYLCDRVTDVGIAKIVEGCPNLLELYLDYCDRVTDVGITKIAEGCSKLHSLDLEFCSKVTEDGLSKIVEGCTQLKYLNLRHCEQVTKVWIMKFKKKYHNILFNY